MQSELFQDDLFPPTTITWTPTMTSDEWYAQKDKKTRKISLQPSGMDSCKLGWVLCGAYQLTDFVHF